MTSANRLSVALKYQRPSERKSATPIRAGVSSVQCRRLAVHEDEAE